MKPALLLAAALLALPSAQAQDSLALDRPSHDPVQMWLTGAAGGSENGLQGGFEVSLGFPAIGGAASVQYVEGAQFLSDAPLKNHRMVNVLFGWVLDEGPLRARVGAGLGYIDGVQHVGWARDKLVDGWLGDYCNCEESAFSGLNVPVRADVLVKPFGFGGAGVFVQANFNRAWSFSSFGLQVALGDLR